MSCSSLAESYPRFVPFLDIGDLFDTHVCLRFIRHWSLGPGYSDGTCFVFFPGGPFLEGPGPFGFCLLLEYFLLLISDTLLWSGALAMSFFSFYRVPSMLGICIWQFHWLG